MVKIRPKARLERRYRHFKTFFGIILIMLLGAVALLYWYSHATSYAIAEVRVKGISLSNEALVKDEAKVILEEKWFMIFPRANWLLFPVQKLEKQLHSNPIFEQVSVEVSAKDLNINLVERQPSYLYCGSEPTLIERCYFVDAYGLVFADAPVFKGNAYIKLFKELYVGPEEIIGLTIEPAEFLERLRLSIEALNELKLSIDRISFENQFQTTLYDSSGLELRLDNRSSTKEILERLKALMSSSEAFTRFSDFDYIDLQSEHKIFFKRKQ